MVLMAQSVPTATAVPCVASFPAGWQAGDVSVKSDRSRFQLQAADNRRRGHAASSSTSATSDDALEVPSEELGARRYDASTQLPPDVRAMRTYVFDGGCVTVDYALDDAADASLLVELDRALSFQPRGELVDDVDERTGLTLCGAGAPPSASEVERMTVASWRVAPPASPSPP